MTDPTQRPLLIVEDSDDDLFLFRRLLSKAGVSNPLLIATTGQDAIDKLSAIVAHLDQHAAPRIVFLDLKLPLRSGFEVLQWIRSQPALKRTVVVVLSSSAEARDVSRSYELGANGYLVKYPEPAVFREVVDSITVMPADAEVGELSVSGMTKPA